MLAVFVAVTTTKNKYGIFTGDDGIKNRAIDSI
jgi:hypothetical protein